MSIEACCGPYR